MTTHSSYDGAASVQAFNRQQQSCAQPVTALAHKELVRPRNDRAKASSLGRRPTVIMQFGALHLPCSNLSSLPICLRKQPVRFGASPQSAPQVGLAHLRHLLRHLLALQLPVAHLVLGLHVDEVGLPDRRAQPVPGLAARVHLRSHHAVTEAYPGRHTQAGNAEQLRILEDINIGTCLASSQMPDEAEIAVLHV